MAADPAVAVIGIGCRFPGAASPAGFWDLLLAGRTEIREVPEERTALRAAGGYGGCGAGLGPTQPGFVWAPACRGAAVGPRRRPALRVGGGGREGAARVAG